MTRSINLKARLTMEYLYRKWSLTEKKTEYWEPKPCSIISDAKKPPKTWRLKLRPLRV